MPLLSLRSSSYHCQLKTNVDGGLWTFIRSLWIAGPSQPSSTSSDQLPEGTLLLLEESYENAPVGSQSTSIWTEDAMGIRTMQRCLLKWCKLILRNYQYFRSCSVLKHSVFQCWGPPQSMPYLSRKNKSKSRKDPRQQWAEQDKAGLLMSSLSYYFFS